MTTKKLLNNLTTLFSSTCEELTYSFKVVAKTQHNQAKTVYIMVFDFNETPYFLLRYRLDINYLADIYAIYKSRATSSELKRFEKAIEE